MAEGNWKDYIDKAQKMLDNEVTKAELRVANADTLLTTERTDDWFSHFVAGALFGAAQILEMKFKPTELDIPTELWERPT